VRERVHWRDTSVDGMLVLKWIFKKWAVGVWTGSSRFMIGTGGGKLRMQ